MAAFVYIVECADGTYYTGWTNDLENRIASHNDGTGARYTRSRGPVRLAYMESLDDKQAAQRREWAIKKLTRLQKEQMVSIFDGKGCRNGEDEEREVSKSGSTKRGSAT